MQQTLTAKTFTDFYTTATALRSGVDFGRDADARPTPFTDSAQFNGRAIDMTIGPVVSPLTVATDYLSTLPANRWLTEIGAIVTQSAIVGRNESVSSPILNSKLATSWVGDGFDAPAIAAATFSSSQSKTFTVRTEAKVTRRMKHLQAFDAAAYLKANMEIALFEAMQSQILVGDGLSNRPHGLLSSGNLALTVSGAASTIRAMLAAATTSLSAQSATRLAVIASPDAREELMEVETPTGYAWEYRTAADGRQIQTMHGLPAFTDEAISGSRLVVGDFRALQVTLAPQTTFVAYGGDSADGGNTVVAFADFVWLSRDKAFSVITLS